MRTAISSVRDQYNQVFPKIDDSGNAGNKGLCREEQNKLSKISYLQWGLNPKLVSISEMRTSACSALQTGCHEC